MSPVAARRPVSRATTRPRRGSSITRTPGTRAATSPVASVLALLTTMISSGGLDCASRECRHAARYPASLCAQTMTLRVNSTSVVPSRRVPRPRHTRGRVRGRGQDDGLVLTELPCHAHVQRLQSRWPDVTGRSRSGNNRVKSGRKTPAATRSRRFRPKERKTVKMRRRYAAVSLQPACRRFSPRGQRPCGPARRGASRCNGRSR